jgi:hypothetical protein
MSTDLPRTAARLSAEVFRRSAWQTRASLAKLKQTMRDTAMLARLYTSVVGWVGWFEIGEAAARCCTLHTHAGQCTLQTALLARRRRSAPARGRRHSRRRRRRQRVPLTERRKRRRRAAWRECLRALPPAGRLSHSRPPLLLRTLAARARRTERRPRRRAAAAAEVERRERAERNEHEEDKMTISWRGVLHRPQS